MWQASEAPRSLVLHSYCFARLAAEDPAGAADVHSYVLTKLASKRSNEHSPRRTSRDRFSAYCSSASQAISVSQDSRYQMSVWLRVMRVVQQCRWNALPYTGNGLLFVQEMAKTVEKYFNSRLVEAGHVEYPREGSLVVKVEVVVKPSSQIAAAFAGGERQTRFESQHRPLCKLSTTALLRTEDTFPHVYPHCNVENIRLQTMSPSWLDTESRAIFYQSPQRSPPGPTGSTGLIPSGSKSLMVIAMASTTRSLVSGPLAGLSKSF